MIIRANNLFSNSSKMTTEELETKKISYWLEKLFNQGENKNGRIKEENKAQTNDTNLIFSNTQKEKTSEEKGLAEAIKNHASKAERNRQSIEDMVTNSNRVLLKVSTVFPWKIFPTTILVEETRVTIIKRQLFSSQVHCVDIKNISNVFVETSILFAQLTIVSNTFEENKVNVDMLWKKDALLTRRIIEGLRMFVSRDIDTTGYKAEELVNKLKELSTTQMR